MKITELIIENTLVNELDLAGVGQALGTGAKKAANVAGAVTGGLRGLGTSFKQGYQAGKAYTSGTAAPGAASTGTTTQTSPQPASGNAASAGSATVSTPQAQSTPAAAPTPAPQAQSTPPSPTPTSTGPVPGQEIEMPGTNLKFKYDADWKDSSGNAADPAIQKVLQQLASGVDKASIPRADLNSARRTLGLPAFESRTVGFESKFLGKTI